MLMRVSKWINRTTTGWLALAGLVIFVLFMVFVLPAQSQKAAAETGGAESPDTSLIYNPQDLYEMAEAYGVQGRQAYIRARFTFDLVWPLVYAFFLVTAISWLLQKAVASESRWQVLVLAPLIGMLFDYAENSTASIVMARYPDLSPLAAGLAPVFTLLKWVFVYGSFVILLIAAVVVLGSKLRRAQRKS